MHAVLIGEAPDLSTAQTRYAHPTNVFYKNWQANEDTGGFGDAAIAISDAIVVTKLTFWITNSNTSGLGWTFTVRQNKTDTAASVSVLGSNTSATWTGAVPLNQLDLMSVGIVPVGTTPVATGKCWWIIEYESVGSDYYLAMGSALSNQSFDLYANPFSGGCPYSATATDYEVVVPHDCTVTKIAGTCQSAPGGTYVYAVRKNNTTDSSFTASVSATVSAVSSAGSLAFAAGDTMVIKRTTGGGTPGWVNAGYCITIVPNVPGEVAIAFGNLAALGTSGTVYEAPHGLGTSNAWDATESNVYIRFPACTLKKLYVKLATATGVGSRTRAFTVRSNAADTSVTTSINNASAGNSGATLNAKHAQGDFVSVKQVASNTPNASSAKVGLVMVIPQQRKRFQTNQAIQASLR